MNKYKILLNPADFFFDPWMKCIITQTSNFIHGDIHQLDSTKIERMEFRI